MEEQPRATATNLKTDLIDYFPISGLVLNSLTGKVIIANKQWQDAFSWKAGDLENLNINDIQSACNVGNLFSLLKIMIDSQVRSLEFIHQMPGKEEKQFLQLESVPLKQKFFTLITLNDITDRKEMTDSIRTLNREIRKYNYDLKQTDRLLQEAEERFNRLFDNSADGVAVIDVKDEKLLMSNKALAQLLGLPADEEAAESKLLDYGAQKARMLGMLFKKVNTKEFTFRNDTVVLPKQNGSIMFAGINSSKVVLDRKRYLMLIIRDITKQVLEERRLKESRDHARRSLQFKTDFLANMSHEIRTPLNGIMGMANFLLETNLEGAQAEYAENIKRAADGLLLIINDILDLSRIEAGKMEILPKVVSLGELQGRLEALFSALTDKKEVRFNLDMDPELPEIVKADERRIQQVLTNLIGNAVKFTSKGSITLKTSVLHQNKEELMLKMEVMDTGKGIKLDDQKKLFRKFSMLNSSTQLKTAGTGLGLTISMNLVELMGGEIGVESVPGIGSNFWFTLPVQRVTKEESEAWVSHARQPVKAGVKFNSHVLVVEDVPLNQLVAKLMLENFGCTVRLANNGQEGIELATEEKFDYIFMDIHMPVLDGISATNILRERYKDSLPPIIGLSANAMEGDAERFISQGMDDYISKPVRKEEMAEKLLKWKTVKS